MRGEKTRIFFAIPCGDFFSMQNQIIKSVCKAAHITPIIIEDRSDTRDLWGKIADAIDFADCFVADISSLSPNVVLELGYVVRKKKAKHYAIFISENIEVPSDLAGFTLQKYSNLPEFQRKLIKWISDYTALPDRLKPHLQRMGNIALNFYEEDFLSYERFLKFWILPPQCSFNLTSQGLRFTNAHFPIMTTHLALMQNYTFKFKAKIESKNLGWVVKGTRPFNSYLPTFCVMFQIDQQRYLTPHIYNTNKVDPNTHYNVFKRHRVKLKFLKDGWFTFTTKVVGNEITILNESKEVIFKQNFNLRPYKEYYDFPYKQGEVGFRCYPGEQGVIRYMRVEEIN
ncbi:MAG: TIR domain-containing protein [Thermodesulfobacteriota bacterium]|jgi:hypothetical protein